MKISRPSSAIYTPIHRQSIDKSNFNDQFDKSLNNNLVFEISYIYRSTIKDLNSITPFEVPSSPNGPGVASLLFLPLDFYDTFQKFRSGIQNKDYQEVFGSLLRLSGMPANALCTAGIYISHAVALGALPKTLLLMIPVLNICGLIVCAVEEIGEIIGLHRQYNFGKKFDFNLINTLHNLIENPDPLSCDKSLTEVITYLESHAILLEEKFGKGEVQNLLRSFHELKQKFQDEPYFRRLALEEHLPELKKISGMILSQNLDMIQKEYLQLNPDEVKTIQAMVKKECQDKPILEQRKILEMALSSALKLKWVDFARNVNPWFVKEANLKVVTILDELKKNNMNESDAALHEGFEMMHNMEIQNTKRIITHVLGILALLVGAASMIASLCGGPLGVIIFLGLLAMGLGISRNLMCKGTLDVKGWSFSFDNLFPDFIKKKLFKPPLEEELSAFYRKKKIISITPMTPPHSPFHLTRLYA